jgi:hypothetical protein
MSDRDALGAQQDLGEAPCDSALSESAAKGGRRGRVAAHPRDPDHSFAPASTVRHRGPLTREAEGEPNFLETLV